MSYSIYIQIIMRNLAFINLFPHYSHITEENLVPVPKFESVDIESQDPLISTIFAPDPDTGIPRSDLAVVMSRDTSPEISQFIRDTLMRPLPDGVTSADSDAALEFVKGRSERLGQYAQRLYSIVDSFKAE